eukprot:Opistho-1_new@81778
MAPSRRAMSRTAWCSSCGCSGSAERQPGQLLRRQGLQHLQRRIGIVGRVQQLALAQLGHGPVGGGDLLGLVEVLAQHHADRGTHAHGAVVALLAEDGVQVQHRGDLDAQLGMDLAVVGLQAEADLEHGRRLQQMAQGLLRGLVAQLEDESPAGQGELDNVGAVADLAGPEGGPGLGIEAGHPGRQDLVAGRRELGRRARHEDLRQAQADEGFQQIGLGLAGRDAPARLRAGGPVHAAGERMLIRGYCAIAARGDRCGRRLLGGGLAAGLDRAAGGGRVGRHHAGRVCLVQVGGVLRLAAVQGLARGHLAAQLALVVDEAVLVGRLGLGFALDGMAGRAVIAQGLDHAAVGLPMYSALI